MSLLRHKLFLAVSLAHFIIDVFSNMGSVLLSFLSVPMALSMGQIGLAIGSYQLISATTQPLFGWLSDKIGSRWLGSLSVPWTVGFLAIAVFTAQSSGNFRLFLIPFLLAAVGSGAFHPQGAMNAGSAVISRAATGTALFFLFGQGGLASGPALAGLILDTIGLTGIYLAAVASVPILLFIAYQMRASAGPSLRGGTGGALTEARPAAAEKTQWGAVVLLALVVGLRSWAFMGTAAFLPKIFQNAGWNPTSYGLITGTFWLASGFAGVLAGNLADRRGRRQVVFTTLLLGSILLYFLPPSNGWLAILLAAGTGGLLGASHSIFIVIIQALVPGRKAFASGVGLGYMFGIGALAIWGIGALAESWGLTLVIQLGAGLGMAGAFLALFLPGTRQATQPDAEGVPA